MGQPYTLLSPASESPSDVWLRLGLHAQVANQIEEADRAYKQAIRLDPHNFRAFNNLAVLAATQRAAQVAFMLHERATMLAPKNGRVWANWAYTALENAAWPMALHAATQGVAVDPCKETALALAQIHQAIGASDKAAEIYDSIDPAGDLRNAYGYIAAYNSVYCRSLCSPEPEAKIRAWKRWYETMRWRGPRVPHQPDPTWPRPLRVGYVSGDFRQHSACNVFSRVVLGHSDAIHPILYSSIPPAEGIQAERFKKLPYRDISGLNDEQANELIRQDQVDILVDLSGHTGGSRLALFTRKPAPVQITAWGFAHGTGVPEMDYFFADDVVVLPEEEPYYAERIYRLPCVATFEPRPDVVDIAGTSPAPVRQTGTFTFGCFNRYEKLNAEYLKACGEILRGVPGSRMWFKDQAFFRPTAIRRVEEIVGVEPERLYFALGSEYADHLVSMQQCDLMLDTFPHTGGVTSLEALWMGVPVLTLYGRWPGERLTASFLLKMGRGEWVTNSVDAYVARARELVANGMLEGPRASLRQQLMDSPVVKGYTEAVEHAYQAIWRAGKGD